MSSSFNLSGKVILEGGSAIKTAETLANRVDVLGKNARTTAATLKSNAQAMEIGTRAALNEAKALSTLTVAQQKANAVQRESLAAARLVNAKTGAVNSGSADKSLVAEGQAQLAQNRALTEIIRQRIAVEDAEGRAALRSAQINSASIRDRIAQERLAMSQERALAAAQNATHASAERSASALDHIGSTAAHVGTVGAAAFIGLTANAVVMEKEFAKVVRTSSYIDSTPQELKSEGFKNQADAIGTLRKQFDALATELPLSYKELTDIGAAANQLGIKSKNLAEFTKVVAQFSATTGVSVDTASTAFGRLNSLVTDVTRNGQKVAGSGVDDNFQALADSINKVGVTSVATDQQIINIASQIAGIANAAGLGYKEIVGFSGALASVAVSPYLARGATTRLFTDIGNAVSDGGKDLEQFARVSGVSAKQFSDEWNNDPQKALVNLFHGINSSGKDAVNVMSDLGIKSVLDQPALLRVAKLADSAGVAGEGLAESFRNASDAAGTNQRQYEKIATTVSSRLQIALNRVQILFRNIASSNLGPLGQAISAISAGVLSLGQSLDKPVKLLGQFPLWFTNGDLLGTVAAVAGVGGGLLLVVSALAKVGSAFLRVRSAGQFLRGVISGNTAANKELAASATSAAAATDALSAAETRQVEAGAAATAEATAQAGANRALAARSAAAATPMAFPVAQTSKRVFSVDSSGVASEAASLADAQKKSTLLTRALGAAGAAGSTAGSKIAGGFRTAAGGIRAGASALSGFVGGPVGMIALGAIATGALFSGMEQAFRSVGTTASDASVQIAKSTNALQIASKTKIGANEWSGILNKDTTSFVDNQKQLTEGFKNLGGGGLISDLGAKFHGFFGGDTKTWFNNFTVGLDKLDGGFRELADSGNVDGAVKGIQELFKGQDDSSVTNGLSHMSNATAILRERLDQAGIGAGKNDENLLKLARSSAILGAAEQKAAAQADYQTRAFNGDAAAAATFSEAQGKLIDQALDLNAAYTTASQGAGKSGASFASFIKQAKKNYSDLVEAQGNALTIAADTGADFDKLSQLDPHILAGAIKGTKKDEQALADALELPDAAKAFDTGLAAIANNPKLELLYRSLGPKLQDQLKKSLKNGAQIDEAFAGLGPKIEAAYKKAVAGTQLSASTTGTVDVDPKIAAKALANAKAVVHMSLDPSLAIKQGETAATLISNIRAELLLKANTLPATTAGQTAADYIKTIKPVMDLLGNSAPAVGVGESAASYLARLKPMMTLLANNLPAIKSGESAKHYVDRLRGTITIAGNGAAAMAEANRVAAAISRKQATMTIDLNTATAQAKFDYFFATNSNRSVPSSIAAPGHAAGGLIRGPGSGTSDSIPSMLSNGEYVVRAKQVIKHRNLLDAINYGARGYASGGVVTAGSAQYEGAATSSYSRQKAKSADSVFQITELSAYDRHLLQVIADNIGVTIAPDHIANASTNVFTTQARRGNG